jgi:hypothetical protein
MDVDLPQMHSAPLLPPQQLEAWDAIADCLVLWKMQGARDVMMCREVG